MRTRQKILLAVAALGLLHFGLLIVFGDRGLADLQRERSAYRRQIAANQSLERSNAVLLRRIERLKNDPAYLEAVARRELLLVHPDEVVVTLPASDAERSPTHAGK